jgi:Lar family restriction alleviation protein
MRDSEIDALQRALLACPHCGGPAGVENMARTELWHRVRCADYKCGATTWAQRSVAKAIDIWNMRNGKATGE